MDASTRAPRAESTPTILRLGDRVRIAASGRVGEIVSLYDGPYEGDAAQARAFARLRMTDGTPDARAIADLQPVSGSTP